MSEDLIALLSDSVKIVVPAFIGFIGVLVGGFWQHRSHIKGKEIESNHKGQELKFSYYKDRIDNNNKILEKMADGLGQLGGMSVVESTDIHGGYGLTDNLSSIIASHVKVAPLKFNRLKHDLSGFGDKYQDIVEDLDTQLEALSSVRLHRASIESPAPAFLSLIHI